MATSKPRLTYFKGRGRAEVDRIGFSILHIDYEDVYIETTEQLVRILKEEKSMFRQFPLLEFDGRCMIGSDVILRHFCRKANLLGKTEEELDRVNELFMGARDMALSLYDHLYVPIDQQAPIQDRALAKCREQYLPAFEKVLRESKSGFLVGDSLTMADMALFDCVTVIYDDPKLKANMDNFPLCRAFIAMFSRLPGVAEYLASPRRFPPPAPDYMKRLQDLRPMKEQ